MMSTNQGSGRDHERGDGRVSDPAVNAFPCQRARLGRTLVVEAVNAVDAGALVVAPQNEKVLRVLDLVRKQQADGLHALLASVDIVAQKQIVGVGREAAVLKQAEQVVVLPVDIACAPISSRVRCTMARPSQESAASPPALHTTRTHRKS